MYFILFICLFIFLFFHFLFFVFFRKIRLDISCKLSAYQTIHMKCQVLFSLKNSKKKIRMLSATILLSASGVKRDCHKVPQCMWQWLITQKCFHQKYLDCDTLSLQAKVCAGSCMKIFERANELKPRHEMFVCVEVLRPSQPNGVMSSVVSLPNHTFTGQA